MTNDEKTEGTPFRHSSLGIRHFTRFASWALILLVRAYQMCIRPLLVGTCKFAPTCSEYAIEAIRRHGPWRGGWLGLRRLTRCHPFSTGGVDPVPF